MDHYQLARVIDVYVRPEGEDLGRIADAVSDITGHLKLQANTQVDIRGMVQNMRTSFHSFALGLLLALALLYLVLIAQFRSFVDPLIILLAVPPGIAGVILTLLSTGTTINIMSLMGIIMLAGIAVPNSILMVEFARHLRSDGGLDVRAAIANSCRVRLRPVLMTSLATIIGGLSLSVVLTIVLVPAAYYLVHRSEDRV